MKRSSRAGIVDRPHVSPWLLWSAEHHAALARQIEESRPDGRKYPWIEHRAYVISSVIASASFLEAVINELFQDVADRGAGLLRSGDQLGVVTEPMPGDIQVRMRAYWAETQGGRRVAALAKYQRLLEIAGCEPLDPKVVDDAGLLLDVRNEPVHYRPRDHYHAKQARTFETKLKARRIEPNPLVGNADRAYWPEHALGAGLASWGIEAVRALSDQTCAAMGLDPTYARYKRGTWFDAKPGVPELYMRRGRRRPPSATDDRLSPFGNPSRPDRDQTVTQYQNRSMHKLHVAEWHRAEFERLEGELTTLDFFDFDTERFLPAQAHADGSLIQLAAAFDAFACAVAHRYGIDEKDPDSASFRGEWWNARLIDAADPELANLIRSVSQDPVFDGLMFYRNLAAHRGVMGEQQRGGSVDEVGTDGVRFMLPDWLPIEAPDYPSYSVRPILERYLPWGRRTVAGLNALASIVWNLEDEEEGELVLREEMFEATEPDAGAGSSYMERAPTPEELAPQFGEWRAWFEWGSHSFSDGSTVLPAWYLRRGDDEPSTIGAVGLGVEDLRGWFESVLGVPLLAKAVLWQYRPRPIETKVGLVLAPGVRR